MGIRERLFNFIVDIMPDYVGKVGYSSGEFEHLKHNESFIIYNLANIKPASRQEDYDRESEKEKHLRDHKADLILDFYGEYSYTDANIFALLLHSSKGFTIQEDHKLCFAKPSSINSLDFQIGEAKKIERYQVMVSFLFSERLEISVNGIDVINTQGYRGN